jgi:hypothetical protein
MTEYPRWLAGLADLLDQAVNENFCEWRLNEPRANASVAWAQRDGARYQDNVFLCRLVPSMSFAARHEIGVVPWWRQPFREMPKPVLKASGNPDTVLRQMLSWPADGK